jgi:hypothetical protein
VFSQIPKFGWFTIAHLFSVLHSNSASHVKVYPRADKGIFYESRASLKQYFSFVDPQLLAYCNVEIAFLSDSL